MPKTHSTFACQSWSVHRVGELHRHLRCGHVFVQSAAGRSTVCSDCGPVAGHFPCLRWGLPCIPRGQIWKSGRLRRNDSMNRPRISQISRIGQRLANIHSQFAESLNGECTLFNKNPLPVVYPRNPCDRWLSAAWMRLGGPAKLSRDEAKGHITNTQKI